MKAPSQKWTQTATELAAGTLLGLILVAIGFLALSLVVWPLSFPLAGVLTIVTGAVIWAKGKNYRGATTIAIGSLPILIMIPIVIERRT